MFTQHSVRYEVQDPEPDEAGGHGTTYKASAGALIPIPKDSTGLSPYPVGKQVLARYPETTTFYRAEVMGTKASYLSAARCVDETNTQNREMAHVD